uniref:Telomere length regulation protein conserved domain-containing protein n=1 Tax=Plectus sambesii TaxID=2011161 RepID=A0A914VH47_9BILA
MDACGLLDRVREAKDRAQIVSVLSDCIRFAESCGGEDGALTVASYAALLGALISRTSSALLGCLTKQELNLLYHQVFLKGPPIDAFMSVVNGIGAAVGDGYKTEKLLALVDRLEHDRLSSLFCALTARTADTDAKWSDLTSTVAQSLVSLPEKIANVTKGAKSQRFHANRHLRLLVLAIRSALETAHNRLTNGQDADLRFVANILCKLCVVGSGNDSVRPLVSWLSRKMEEHPTDYIWDRIAERLTTGESNRRLLESILIETILAARHRDLSRILGDSVVRDSRVEYFLTHKLLLVRCFDVKYQVPEKVATYLASGERRRVLLCATLLKLLDVWANADALLRSALEQRQYLTRSILVFAKRTTTDERARLRIDVEQRVLLGVQPHLGCVDSQRRQLGMFVAEVLTQWFADPARGDSAQLRFDYKDEDEYLKELRAIVNANEDVGANEPILDELDSAWLEDGSVAAPCETDEQRQQPLSELVDDAVDSDDDLVPYEIPIDELSFTTGDTDKRAKTPVYINDCFEQLLEDKDYSKFEAALFGVEALIRRRAVGFNDIAVRLCERLVFLEDRFSTKDFERHRQAALIACCANEPVAVSKFLCTQFYARNYTISQRLVILQTLASAAQELSAVDRKDDDRSLSPSGELSVALSEALPIWRQVIDARIAKKTRHFRSVEVQVPTRTAKVNRFAAVCDHFFFPLLHAASGGAHLDLMGRDYMLLGRLLFTLGTVVHCAENCPRVLAMAKALADIVWPLRFHDERFIRQAALYCYCTIATSVPARLLALEFADSVAEWVAWITAVADNDPSSECQALAKKTASLLASRLDDSFRDVVRID